MLVANLLCAIPWGQLLGTAVSLLQQKGLVAFTLPSHQE